MVTFMVVNTVSLILLLKDSNTVIAYQIKSYSDTLCYLIVFVKRELIWIYNWVKHGRTGLGRKIMINQILMF